MMSRRGRWGVAAIALVFALSACGSGSDNNEAGQAEGGSGAGKALPVVVVALDHAPVRQVMGEVDQVLGEFGDRVEVRRLDFESEEGEAFAKTNGVTGHVPMAIFVDGSSEATIDGRKVNFVGFPQGRGPRPDAEGNWSIEMLRTALNQRAGTR